MDDETTVRELLRPLTEEEALRWIGDMFKENPTVATAITIPGIPAAKRPVPRVGTSVQRGGDAAARKLFALAGCPPPPSTDRRRRPTTAIRPAAWAGTSHAAESGAAKKPRIIADTRLTGVRVVMRPPPAKTAAITTATIGDTAPPPPKPVQAATPAALLETPPPTPPTTPARTTATAPLEPPAPGRWPKKLETVDDDSDDEPPADGRANSIKPGEIRVMLPTGRVVGVPTEATQRAGSYRVIANGQRWALWFHPDGTLKDTVWKGSLRQPEG